MKKIFFLCFGILFFYAAYCQTPDAVTLYEVEIAVTHIKEYNGTIIISIHDSSKSFNKRLAYRTVELPANGEKAVYHIRLKAGDYVFCVYHDVNSDGKLNTNALGIPKEPFGFSNYEGKGPPGNFKKHKVFIGSAMTVPIPLTKPNEFLF